MKKNFGKDYRLWHFQMYGLIWAAVAEHFAVRIHTPSPARRGYLRIAIKSVGIDKTMFGSDVPSVLTKESYEHLIGWISRSEELTENEKGENSL